MTLSNNILSDEIFSDKTTLSGNRLSENITLSDNMMLSDFSDSMILPDNMLEKTSYLKTS
jgi:hypothetical protein